MTFVKGHKLATGRPVGSKNVRTLEKEERRRIFEEEASQIWIDTIRKLPPTYVADQFMGKAPEVIQAQIETTFTPEEREKLLSLLQ
jgi:hypothetical protein